MQAHKQPHHAAAFTLLELVVVMILVGILAAVILPRFTARDEYEARTARDDLISTLRLAQQLAMADSEAIVVPVPARQIQFVSTSNSYSILIGGTPLSLPELGGNFPRALASSVSLSPATTLSYGALGDTSATTFTLSGNSSERVCVESSGYAYAC